MLFNPRLQHHPGKEDQSPISIRFATVPSSAEAEPLPLRQTERVSTSDEPRGRAKPARMSRLPGAETYIQHIERRAVGLLGEVHTRARAKRGRGRYLGRRFGLDGEETFGAARRGTRRLDSADCGLDWRAAQRTRNGRLLGRMSESSKPAVSSGALS
jgi:hypothetical protein